MRRTIVEHEGRDREHVPGVGVQEERVLERHGRDATSFGAEPAGGLQLGSVEPVERLDDLGAADLDGDRLRYPC
jgi:hypothetical protein